MESCQYQYICSWNGDLHIYTSRGQLRNTGFFEHYNRWRCIANFSNHWKFILPKFHTAGTPSDFKGRNYRNMESGQHQYICPRNCDIYIYPICGKLLASQFL